LVRGARSSRSGRSPAGSTLSTRIVRPSRSCDHTSYPIPHLHIVSLRYYLTLTLTPNAHSDLATAPLPSACVLPAAVAP